jgi:hypothetical protein
MTILRPAGALGFYILCAAGAVAAAAAPEPPPGKWHFTVLLDGKRIGAHDFAVERHGEETDVVTEAHFRVKAAFISLYQYDHQDHEVWHNGCLARLSSHTRDNGKSFTVQGDLKGDAFEVQGSRGAATLPACISTFAYWDQRFLTERRLLNSQTGEFQPVILMRDGPQSVTVRGQTIPAQRYSLHAPKLDIELWYSDSGDWIALESKLASGRTLRYEIQ